MRIVVVDDSLQRVELIRRSLNAIDFAKYLDVIYCDTADAARRALMAPCDLLLLDVRIPKKTNGTPQAKNSIDLLGDICAARKSYIRPGLIIGLTADISELGSYQAEFAREATVVLSGTLTDIAWVDRLTNHIESLLESHRKASQHSKDRLLISVHGIRTYGHWQADLTKEISEHSRFFECVEIKYGFLDLMSFLVPRRREKTIERTAQRIRVLIDRGQDREVFIVAHSFGTLIVARALTAYKFSHLIKGVIFCGSPMLHTEDIDGVVGAAELTLNDCGIHDFVLLCARFFGLGLGDAGRVGFERENSDRFRNRYFKGGHGLYFGRYGKKVRFFEKFWLPVIVSGASAVAVDARRDYIGQDFVDLFIKFMTFSKPFLYVFGAVLAVFLLFRVVV